MLPDRVNEAAAYDCCSGGESTSLSETSGGRADASLGETFVQVIHSVPKCWEYAASSERVPCMTTLGSFAFDLTFA